MQNMTIFGQNSGVSLSFSASFFYTLKNHRNVSTEAYLKRLQFEMDFNIDSNVMS